MRRGFFVNGSAWKIFAVNVSVLVIVGLLFL
jgi:hypothetical protein